MNIISLILAILAVVLFILAENGRVTIALGLAVLATAWIIQLLWTTGKQITF